MKLIREKVAGLDIHRDTVVACCRVHHQGQRVDLAKGTFATTTKGLKELVDWLREASTGNPSTTRSRATLMSFGCATRST